MATKHLEKFGVDIIINDLHDNPHCEHGPTVLFERFSLGKSVKYYACSACRLRKLCSFYKAYENRNSKSSEKHIINKNKRRNIFQVTDLSKFFFCASCVDIYPLTKAGSHSKCKQIKPLNSSIVKFPTKMLTPKENAKFEAQYLFTDKCTAQIAKLINDINAKKVLCIGSPRIYEFLKNRENQLTKCLLLDIDERFYSFYSEGDYLKYNLFNHYFFDGTEAVNTYKAFLKGNEKIVLLMDPPFGGRMELIANTLNLIEKEWRQVNQLKGTPVLPAMLVFPYFLERSIKKSLPPFTMLDYQVDYDNHPLYTTGTKGMKNGSAVRLFVNISPKLFAFPENEGYRLCRECDRWVHNSNVHCSKCQGCMSKDGTTYEHCDSCGKCVKPSWLHCSDCKNCLPKFHNCSEVTKSSKCHICGSETHKRTECPKRRKIKEKTRKKKKRKLN